MQQTIKLLQRQKVSSLFLKLDISKAFDSVSWSFLMEVLSHLGSGQRWCNLVSSLVNGAPGESIIHQRGLRPLSPMLFIIVMDVLNSLVTKAGEEGLLQPLSRRAAGQRISLYADDVALFIRPVEEELRITKGLLECFGAASGLHTNLNKSCVVPIHCEDTAIQIVQDTMQCPTKEFPCIYLGLPVSNKKLYKRDLVP